MIYLIGSLRNPEVPNIANKLREKGHEVFDDWYAAGPEADDKWRDYEKQRGRSFTEGLQGLAAGHVFAFDFEHLDRASHVVLVLPAGKSGHMELGWAIGRGKKGYILLDDPERWDVMYRLASKVTTNLDEISDDIQARNDQPRDEPRDSQLLYTERPVESSLLVHRSSDVNSPAQDERIVNALRQRRDSERIAGPFPEERWGAELPAYPHDLAILSAAV